MTDAAALLTVDLAAVAENWRRLKARLGGGACAGVVKADAYGLGAAHVGPALYAAGCRTFFVALAAEGAALREVLPDAEIHVLGGLLTGPVDDFFTHNLVPVLNSLNDVSLWRAACDKYSARRPADLHIDTGMSRLGLDAGETTRLKDDPSLLAGIEIDVLMSHLACADDPAHPLNKAQRGRFAEAAARIPARRASLANSSGIFLGADYHFDLARPGAALYGVNPTPGPTPGPGHMPGGANPMLQAVRLRAKILQVRRVAPPDTVGYGAAYTAQEPMTIAVAGAGYADGYFRSISNTGHGVLNGRRTPVVGRISMDLTAFDVSGAAEADARPGAWIDLINSDHDVDALAREAGTIGYEILTALGARYERAYVSGVNGAEDTP
ncbi:MAG: alanine racemase [Rhodospirillales bacterium]